MNDDRICGFCHKPPEQGKLLFCQHVFCLKCLTNQLLKHFDEKVKKDGVKCLLCPMVTQFDIKRKKRFNLSLDKSNSKRLYVVSNLDRLLPDICQSTYEGDANSNVTMTSDTSAVPKNHSTLADHARRSVSHESLSEDREANIAGNANDDTFTTPFHNDFLRQSSTLLNPCCCSILKNWKCKTCNQTFCEPCVSNHLADESKIHELFNQFQCIYCLGTKTWHCNICDKPLCAGCLAIHLEELGKHEVVTTEEQKSVRAANFQQGASSSSAPWDPIFDMMPSAPTYYSTTPEAKTVNGQHANDAPLVSTQELTAKKLINGIDEDYRPPAEYITLNKKFNIPSSSDKPPPPIPKRPSPTELHSAAVQHETCPPEVKPILHLNTESWAPKKFCIDNAGQIFILFAENGREICRFDRHSGTSLSSIKSQTNIIDMNYNEKNDALLLLSKSDNDDFYFLQKYNVFNSKLVDIFELGSERCLFVVLNKKNHQQVFVVMLNKIKVIFVTFASNWLVEMHAVP